VRLLRGTPPLADVAPHTRTDQVFPARSASQTAWQHVVQAQFAGREPFAAILAAVGVAGKNIATVKSNPLSGDAIVVQQPQDSRDADFEIDALNPILFRMLVFGFQLADRTPRVEIVVGVLAIFDMDDLGKLVQQQAEGSPHIDQPCIGD